MEKVIDVTKCSLKDFESNGSFNLADRASHFYNYIEWRNTLKQNTYRVDSLTGSGTALLSKEDIAILDMYVHASVVDGCCNTNKKFFLHNNMESLESILKVTSKTYRHRIMVVDGVYS